MAVAALVFSFHPHSTEFELDPDVFNVEFLRISYKPYFLLTYLLWVLFSHLPRQCSSVKTGALKK